MYETAALRIAASALGVWFLVYGRGVAPRKSSICARPWTSIVQSKHIYWTLKTPAFWIYESVRQRRWRLMRVHIMLKIPRIRVCAPHHLAGQGHHKLCCPCTLLASSIIISLPERLFIPALGLQPWSYADGRRRMRLGLGGAVLYHCQLLGFDLLEPLPATFVPSSMRYEGVTSAFRSINTNMQSKSLSDDISATLRPYRPHDCRFAQGLSEDRK